jgi:hypothetical protein
VNDPLYLQERDRGLYYGPSSVMDHGSGLTEARIWVGSPGTPGDILTFHMEKDRANFTRMQLAEIIKLTLYQTMPQLQGMYGPAGLNILTVMFNDALLGRICKKSMPFYEALEYVHD